MPDLTSVEMSNFGLELSGLKPTEKPVEKPPVEQKKPISERARSLVNKIAFWKKSTPNPNPDIVFKEIADLPLEQPEQAVQVEPLPVPAQEVPEAPKVEPQTEPVAELEEVVDLSPENIAKSQQEYIIWRRSQYEELVPSEADESWTIGNIGSYRAVEPGRANIFCHASTTKGAVNILSSGAIKSAAKVLLEDGSLAHAPKNRMRVPPKAMMEGKIFSQMTPSEQIESLSYAQTYVAGTLGVAVMGYTVEESPDGAGMIDSEKNIDTQTAVVFPLQVLKEKRLRFEKHFKNPHPEDISPENIELVEMNLKYLPTNAKHNTEHQGSGSATMEINFDNLDANGERIPGQIDLDGSILLVRENKVDEISKQVRERMLAQGKSQREIEESLSKIVGFSTEFISVDEAVGWLSNSTVGQALVAVKTGMRIDKIPEAQLRPESDYVKDFIIEYQRETSILERKRKIEEEEMDDIKKNLEDSSLRSSDRRNFYKREIKSRVDGIKYCDASIRFQSKIVGELEEKLKKLSGVAN